MSFSDDSSVSGDIAMPENGYAFDVVSNHPGRAIERGKGWSEARILAENNNKEQSMERVMQFISMMVDFPSCFNRDTKRFTNCFCLRSLDHDQIGTLAESLG